MNKHLKAICCPTCRESCWLLSANDAGELHIECVVCPPGPAVPLTPDHVHSALAGVTELRR